MTIINDFALFFTLDFQACVSEMNKIFAIDLLWCPASEGEECE